LARNEGSAVAAVAAMAKAALEDLYGFVYSDGLRQGVHITEQLRIDRLSGRFTWSRARQNEAAKLQGSSYLISQVSSVRFTTRLGDPNCEFLSAAQKQIHKQRQLRSWLKSHAPVILGLIVMIFNVVTLTLILAACLAHAMWLVFPRAGEHFDMSQGPDTEALGAASTLAVLTALCAIVTGWWLGIFRCRCCGFNAFHLDSLGVAERLSDKIAARCRIQRPITGAVLVVCIIWCFFLVILCPVAYGLSRKTLCDSGSCTADPGSTLLPTCGVGNCSCGGLADLACGSATTGQDLNICQNVKQPMCTVEGSGQTASGVQLPLLAAAVGSTALAILLGLVWLLNAWAMYAGWIRSDRDLVLVPQIMYHRFAVNFRSRNEGKLVFTLSAEDDPLAIAAALMPRGQRTSLAVMYQAPETMIGTYMPGAQGAMTGSEWAATGYSPSAAGDTGYTEPRWC